MYAIYRPREGTFVSASRTGGEYLSDVETHDTFEYVASVFFIYVHCKPTEFYLWSFSNYGCPGLEVYEEVLLERPLGAVEVWQASSSNGDFLEVRVREREAFNVLL